MPNKSRKFSRLSAWHTEGAKILDSQDRPVRIAGVSWFGMETNTYAPHGLWTRGYRDIVDQVASLGYNTIRLPFCNEMLEEGRVPNGIDFSKNDDLRGLKPIEVMDRVIACAGDLGLRIILDRHRPDSAGQSELWYTDAYPESRFLGDWVFLAGRYRGNPVVVGADLHNEPHGAACWGGGDLAFDWRLAAQRAGDAIHAVNPDWLIFIEGTQSGGGETTWWGGNLRGVRDYPVALRVANRVVYSPHDYPSSVFAQEWFSGRGYPAKLRGVWDRNWGYIHREGLAPVLLGEFGSKLDTVSDRQWLDELISYLGEGPEAMSWTYWCLNANSDDTGGILMDDWTSVHQRKHERLVTIQFQLADSVTD